MTVVRRTNPLGELISLRQTIHRLSDDSVVRSIAMESGRDQTVAPEVYPPSDPVVVEAPTDSKPDAEQRR